LTGTPGAQATIYTKDNIATMNTAADWGEPCRGRPTLVPQNLPCPHEYADKLPN